MKNLFISILCFFSTLLFAQEKESIAPKDYTVTMDSLLKYVKRDNMKTGLLYDRVVANANLLEFNNKDSKLKSSYWHYIQALSEVHRSSLDQKNKMQYEIVEDLRHKNDNVLNISYINTSIDYIDFGTEKEPNLVFKDGFFYTIEGRNPFKQKQVTVVAVIAETIYSQEVKIKLNPDMLYQDDSNPIKNLTAIINGAEIKLVVNFENLIQETSYKLNGDEKEMVFRIEFKDETKIQTRAALSIRLPQITNSDPCYTQDFLGSTNTGIDRTTVDNFPFQGYNETSPIHGVIDYRTYFNQVTNTCNTKKINKPVIILDGFDPGDKRKLDDLYSIMVYKDASGVERNFVDKLTSPAYGYDVTLVNFPENKVIDPVNPVRYVWVWNGSFFGSHWATVTNYKYIIDGGADYIERNAMAVVALLKRENAKLAANGSTEQITLVGPSMGGLISRYALAYMEKNNIPHNVKLWVSFDSPHLGANIPLSTQAQLLFLGTTAESAEALAKYKENLQSPAARQMLIEQIDNYPNSTSLWSNNNKNNNHPFRKQFLQNQITNSNSNSNGFPTNMRKIALINGTTNGMKTNSEGQLVYDLAVFGSFSLKGFFNVDRNLASPGNSITSFEGRFTKKILCGIPFTNMTYTCELIIKDQWRNDLNTNPRGSMDVVPGGTFNTVGIIKKSIDENPAIQENRVENRVYVPNHAFIPTVSSLAFKNPNFDWSTPLNRNLICDPNNKEIPFDSYFSPSKNENHVDLTKESVDWLLAEIQGNPQVPRFDVKESALDGLKLICENQISNYSFGTDVCKLPSLVQSWSVSSTTLQVISSNGFDIIVKGIGNGQGTITATFQNGQTVIKNIWVGKPSFNLVYNYFEPQPIKSTIDMVSDQPDLTIEQQGITSTTFLGTRNNSFYFNMLRSGLYSARANTSSVNQVIASATNSCGTTTLTVNFIDILKQSGNTFPPKVDSKIYSVFPNPASSIVSIELNDIYNQPDSSSIISGELFDMIGLSKSKVEIKDNKAVFSVVGLLKGIYVLKIYINDQVESHQIAVE